MKKIMVFIMLIMMFVEGCASVEPEVVTLGMKRVEVESLTGPLKVIRDSEQFTRCQVNFKGGNPFLGTPWLLTFDKNGRLVDKQVDEQALMRREISSVSHSIRNN